MKFKLFGYRSTRPVSRCILIGSNILRNNKKYTEFLEGFDGQRACCIHGGYSCYCAEFLHKGALRLFDLNKSFWNPDGDKRLSGFPFITSKTITAISRGDPCPEGDGHECYCLTYYWSWTTMVLVNVKGTVLRRIQGAS